MMKKQQGGFTLIELIMVIVILGILAAVALPRIGNLSADARAASINAALGGAKSASAIVHAMIVAKGANGSMDADEGTGQTIDLEGKQIDLVFGYPAATATGILRAAGLEGDYEIVGGVITQLGNPDSLSACSFAYGAATSTTSAPTFITNVGADGSTSTGGTSRLTPAQCGGSN